VDKRLWQGRRLYWEVKKLAAVPLPCSEVPAAKGTRFLPRAKAYFAQRHRQFSSFLVFRRLVCMSLNGLSVSEFSNVITGKCYGAVQWWDQSSLSCSPCAPCDLPWHVAYLLNMSRSTRLVSSATPHITPIMSTIDNFVQGAHWRHHFLGAPPRQLWYRNGLPPSRFPHVPQAEIVAAGRALKDGIGNVIAGASAAARRPEAPPLSNRPRAARLAWAWLRESPYFCIPRDKGGGWILARQTAIADECRRLVEAKGWYVPAPAFDERPHAEIFSQMKAEYKLLCDAVGRHLGIVPHQIFSSALIPNAAPFSLFKMTVKAHKPFGRATARPLHASTKLAWNGAATVLHRLLHPAVSAPWCVNSSTAAITFVREHFVSPVGVYLHVDIVDFFLQGRRADLIDAATHFSPPESKEIVHYITTWLLTNQLVEIGALGKIMRVESGTGMGSRSSGSLAGAGFRYLFESRLLSMFARFNVTSYIRYVDNLLFHVATREDAIELFNWMSTASDTYRFTLEHLDSVLSFCDFTDFSFCYDEVSCSLATRPILKSRGSYISYRSAHLRSSIAGWVAPYYRHLAFLCSHQRMWRLARKTFLAALEHDLPFVARAVARTHFCVPLSQVRIRRPVRRLSCVDDVTFTLVVVYDPSYVRALGRIRALLGAFCTSIAPAFPGRHLEGRIGVRLRRPMSANLVSW
jgi:hypothetical protein